MRVLNDFAPLPCHRTAKSTTSDILNKYESGEIKIRDDRACFIVYSNVDIEIDVP